MDSNRATVAAAIAARRMVRAFSPNPVSPKLVENMLDLARRAPSAGNCQPIRFVVLDTPELTARYWDRTLAGERRSSFRWQQLLAAPLLVLVATEPERYLDRYREPDKIQAGRTEFDQWPVPYWWVDAGMAAQNLLLLATQHRLGACLFGPFDHEPALKQAFDLPPDLRLVATVAIGHPLPDEPGRSAGRPRRPLGEVLIRPGSVSTR